MSMRFLAPVKYKLLVAGLGTLVLAGIAVGASAYAGAGPAALIAAKPSPSPGTSARNQACTDFVHHLAQNLGKSDGATRSALQRSADQTIDDAVAAGKLTAAQAAKLKRRIDGNVCSIGGRFGRPAQVFGLRMLLLKAAAQTLNLTPQQLMQDLRQGKTLSQLAGGMTEAQFRQALTGHLKTDLDALVKQGKVTQAQEDRLLQRLQTAPIPFWDSAPKLPRGAAPTAPAAGGAGA